jgi:hypothetical protein
VRSRAHPVSRQPFTAACVYWEGFPLQSIVVVPLAIDFISHFFVHVLSYVVLYRHLIATSHPFAITKSHPFTRVLVRLMFLKMGFPLADRACIYFISCVALHATLYFLLPKRLGDSKLRLEFAQKLTSAFHALWMFYGAVDSWSLDQFTFRDGADAFKGYASIAEFNLSIDARIDHMLGYLIADQVVQFCLRFWQMILICAHFRHSIF